MAHVTGNEASEFGLAAVEAQRLILWQPRSPLLATKRSSGERFELHVVSLRSELVAPDSSLGTGLADAKMAIAVRSPATTSVRMPEGTEDARG